MAVWSFRSITGTSSISTRFASPWLSALASTPVSVQSSRRPTVIERSTPMPRT